MIFKFRFFEHRVARAIEAAAPRQKALQPQPGAGFGRKDKDRAAAFFLGGCWPAQRAKAESATPEAEAKDKIHTPRFRGLAPIK